MPCLAASVPSLSPRLPPPVIHRVQDASGPRPAAPRAAPCQVQAVFFWPATPADSPTVLQGPGVRPRGLHRACFLEGLGIRAHRALNWGLRGALGSTALPQWRWGRGPRRRRGTGPAAEAAAHLQALAWIDHAVTRQITGTEKWMGVVFRVCTWSRGTRWELVWRPTPTRQAQAPCRRRGGGRQEVRPRGAARHPDTTVGCTNGQVPSQPALVCGLYW